MAKSPESGNSASALSAARKPGVSAKVYRRRRQVVAVLALLVLAGLVAGGIALANFLGTVISPPPDAGATGASTASSAAAPGKPGAAAADVCDESGIKVTGAVDKESYGPDGKPVLELRVTNTGKVPCDINVGTSQMEFRVTSGDDIIFNSRDCQASATNLVRTLSPGKSESANFVWQRKRSAPGCVKVDATPGAGTYVFTATLGKWSSSQVRFVLQ